MCIINTGAIIEHDCKVGEFSHIAVRSVLCEEVSIGKQPLIGANATVIQQKAGGNYCIVGAGTTIRKDVEDYSMIYNCQTIKNAGRGYDIALFLRRAV